MGVPRRFKAWWITDCPDDVARAEARPPRMAEDPEVAEAMVRFLRRDLQESEARFHELARRAEHYRSGWRMGAPFVEFNSQPMPEAARTRAEATGAGSV